jgi:DMSO/TMAO reductase YedYZ molybdopterin-dependent catalytic subunit
MRPLAERVQRIVADDVPILHLEPEMPTGTWNVIVDGLVEQPLEIAMDELHASGTIRRAIDLHCVWGWSRPDNKWEGIPLRALTSKARPTADASYVLMSSRSGVYASCFTLTEAMDGLLAWRVDGRDLKPERGWPLRFIPPAYKWAYKSVKWIERITFLDSFQPGAWESRVGDPKGNVPWDVLERFGAQAAEWRGRKGRR